MVSVVKALICYQYFYYCLSDMCKHHILGRIYHFGLMTHDLIRQWLAMPHNLIFMALHFAISKSTAFFVSVV